MKNLITYLSKKSLSFGNGSGMTRKWFGNDSGMTRFSLVSLICVLMLTLGVGNAWGGTTYDLSTNSYSSNSTSTVVWDSKASTVATMTLSKGNSGTNANNYLGGDANNRTSTRFYSGHVLTIAPAAGRSISSIVFTATSNSYATTFKNSTWTNGSASASSSTVTITPTTGTSNVSVTIGGTCGFTNVEITVTGGCTDGEDVITCNDLAATSTTYVNFSNVAKCSNARYAGNSAKSGSDEIQFRQTNSNSGIVSTTSGGTVVSVTIDWGSNAAGRTLDIYGKNTAYSGAGDLFGDNKGTKLGSIVYGTSTSLDISGSYQYIGIRSSGNYTVYINSITIVWSDEVTYNVYLMSGCTGGSYSSNKGTSGSGTGSYSGCTKYSGISSGTSVTITAAPTSGYQFDGWTDGGYSIIFDDESNTITPSSTTSTTATFTMPSSDVVIWECNFSESCANSVTISKGTQTNCTFTLSPSGAQASCSGVTTTISITPTSGYGTPVVTQSGASSAPTPGGSGNTQTLTYAANTTGTSTINVSCSANNYTITLNKDLTPTTAGTASIIATYNANTNLTSAITKPTKTGWTFGGYFTAKNGGGTQIIDANGNVIASVSGYTDASKNWKYANNITLYAKWTCTVTWSVNGLTNVYSTETVTYNSSGCKVTTVPSPSPGSYCGDVFAGWTTESSVQQNNDTGLGLFSDVSGSPNITGDITFYAVFADYDE